MLSDHGLSDAHLVAHVIPPVPVRLWVLSLPYSLRFRAAFDADLLTDVLANFVHKVIGSRRRRARDFRPNDGPRVRTAGEIDTQALEAVSAKIIRQKRVGPNDAMAVRLQTALAVLGLKP